jgi:hypothetical protein
VVLVPAGLHARHDAFGCQLCEGCGIRINRCKGKLHRHGPGHVCQRCYNQARPTIKPAPKQQREKRPYGTLQSTQQWKRRKQLQSVIAEASQQIGCPVEALHLQQRTTPEELLGLSTATREQIRSIPSLRIPCEQTMIKCKQQLATSHATETV